MVGEGRLPGGCRESAEPRPSGLVGQCQALAVGALNLDELPVGVVDVGGGHIADSKVRWGVARLEGYGGVGEGVRRPAGRGDGGDVSVRVVAGPDLPAIWEGLGRDLACGVVDKPGWERLL